ncbi:MAG: replicative DNA helicase [Bacteroidales bacterium]|jgi:replicative DNA helicase|nr:replicative DNA helicase [Bacteroidales bacterium]
MDTPKTSKKAPMGYDQAFALNGKIPPQAIEIEESVLGALLLDQDALANVIDVIKPEYFYLDEHKLIFVAIYALFQENKPIDILTVVEKMKRLGTLETAGGAYKLASLTNRVTSAAHIEAYARILSEKFIQRELIRLSTETITEAYDDTTDVLALLDKTESSFLEINDSNFNSGYKELPILWNETIKEIEELKQNENSTTGISSGYMDLDRQLGGFQKGTLIILAARPSMGKTSLALNIARNVAVDFKKPVAIFSLEMSGTELMKRLISSEAEISATKFTRADQLEYHEIEQLKIKSEPLFNAPVFIDDTPSLTIFELRAKCRRLKQKHNIEMVFIDYLQLMSGGDIRGAGNREQEISAISRQLKGLSKELSIPIFALAQLSRAVETRGGAKEPILSDLRESGAIEQDADIVMFIYRPDYYGLTEPDSFGETIGMADVIIGKHRAGATGKVRLRFRKEITKFENRNVFGSSHSDFGMGNSSFDSSAPKVFQSKMNDQTSAQNINLPDDFGAAPF